MFEISTRTTFPYSAICYVSVVFPDGYAARGSGSVVGANDVLTAMHVVYEAAHGGWATSISVMPAADTLPFLVTPYGTFTNWGRVNSRTTNWDTNGDGLLSDAEAQWDLAVIGMRSRLGDTTGWLGLSSQAVDTSATMIGYPGRGTGMMAETVFADASAFYGVYDISSDLGPGASGGPLLDATRHVLGVLSSGAGNFSSSTYAGLFGSGTWDWLAGVMAANDDLIGGAATSFTGTSGNDQITGNALNNTIAALGGNDRVEGGGGNDSIDGGSGIDTAAYTGARSGYTLSISGSSATVADRTGNRDGTDTLANVERLAFADFSVALDLGGNAGIVAKTLGAVFGKSSVSNRGYAGIGLALTDAGMSYADLMQLALNARLGTAATNQAVVSLLYTNVVGIAPPAADLALYKGLLDTGQLTQGSLGVLAADTALNLANVGLVGLASSGLEYTPQ